MHFGFVHASQHFLMAKKEMSTLLKGQQIIRQKVEKAELNAKSKETELKTCQSNMVKMEETLKKNGEELEQIRAKVTKLVESSRLEISALQAKVEAQKGKLDLLEAEVTTMVRAKLMYQFMMKKTSSWTPQKDIDLFLKCLGGMKALMDDDELAGTADSPPNADEKAISCAGFIASDVPPEPEIEKEVSAVVPSSATSTEKEADKNSDA